MHRMRPPRAPSPRHRPAAPRHPPRHHPPRLAPVCLCFGRHPIAVWKISDVVAGAPAGTKIPTWAPYPIAGTLMERPVSGCLVKSAQEPCSPCVAINGLLAPHLLPTAGDKPLEPDVLVRAPLTGSATTPLTLDAFFLTFLAVVTFMRRLLNVCTTQVGAKLSNKMDYAGQVSENSREFLNANMVRCFVPVVEVNRVGENDVGYRGPAVCIRRADTQGVAGAPAMYIYKIISVRPLLCPRPILPSSAPRPILLDCAACSKSSLPFRWRR